MKISKYGICYSNGMVNIYSIVIIIVIFVAKLKLIVIGCVSKMCAQNILEKPHRVCNIKLND